MKYFLLTILFPIVISFEIATSSEVTILKNSSLVKRYINDIHEYLKTVDRLNINFIDRESNENHKYPMSRVLKNRRIYRKKDFNSDHACQQMPINELNDEGVLLKVSFPIWNDEYSEFETKKICLVIDDFDYFFELESNKYTFSTLKWLEENSNEKWLKPIENK
jgi:hypothetical protein